jgi:hypothetical protein
MGIGKLLASVTWGPWSWDRKVRSIRRKPCKCFWKNQKSRLPQSEVEMKRENEAPWTCLSPQHHLIEAVLAKIRDHWLGQLMLDPKFTSIYPYVFRTWYEPNSTIPCVSFFLLWALHLLGSLPLYTMILIDVFFCRSGCLSYDVHVEKKVSTG